MYDSPGRFLYSGVLEIITLMLTAMDLCYCSDTYRSLSAEAVKAVVHAFISSRLDYCNSLLTGVNEGLLRRLQSVQQNAAACLVTGTWCLVM